MTTVTPNPIDVPPPRAAVPRRRRRVLRFLLGAVVLLVVVWFFVVPRAIVALVAGTLRDAGVQQTRIGSVHVGPSRLEMQNVQLAGSTDADGEITIASVVAEFSIGDLFAGRIDSLVVDGVVWTRAASPDRGASPFGTTATIGGSDGAPATLPSALPLRRCELRNVAIGRRDAAADDRLRLDASLDAAATSWRIDAKLALATHRATVRADLQRDANAFVGDVAVRDTGGAEIVLDGKVRIDPSEPFVALRFDDASVAVNGLQINGLAAEVRVDGFAAPRTREAQTLRWRELRAGAIAAGSGEATFDLVAGPVVAASVTQRTVDGAGSITVRDLRWTPGQSRFPMSIEVHDVPLREWVELASSGRITGDGTLHGDLDVVVAIAPRLAIDLHGGHLGAAPGGIVRFLDHPDTDVLIRQHVQAIAASTGHDALVQERLIAALKEFRYSALEFVFDRDTANDDTTLRVHLAGAGTNVPQQLDMDVNLHGFDTALDTALAIKLGLDRAMERLDRKVDAPSLGPPKDK